MNITIPLTDFTAGELTPKLEGRIDLPLYMKGAKVLENFIIMSHGGITKRPGSRYLSTLSVGDGRLYSFTTEMGVYLLCFIHQELQIYAVDQDGNGFSGSTVYVETSYTTSETKNLQFAQVENRLYIAAKNHAPACLVNTSSNSFSFSEVSFTTVQGEDQVFESADNYPGCVAFFNGRLWWAGTINEPQTIWASKPFEYESHVIYDTIDYTLNTLVDPDLWVDPEIPQYQTQSFSRNIIDESHAFNLTLSGAESETIQSLTAGKDLIVFSSHSEWVIGRDISPYNIYAIQHTKHGSSPIQAKMVDDAILFIQQGRKIREYYYQDSMGAYHAPDLTFLSDHITKEGIDDFVFTRVPEPLLLVLRSDGSLACCTYNKSAGVSAWTVWIPATGTKFLSIAVTRVGNEDRIFAIHEVIASGVRSLVLFDPIFYDDGFSVYMDCVEACTINTGSVLVPTIKSIYTAGHSLYTNTYYPDTGRPSYSNPYLPDPSTGNGGYPLYIGIPFTCQMQTMRIEPQTFAKLSRIVKVHARVLDSRDFQVGYANTVLLTDIVNTTLFSGNLEIDFLGDSTTDSWVWIVSNNTHPLTILVLIPEIEIIQEAL